MKHALTVVKVGGSLYDFPDLASRLQAWLKQAPGADVLLVPGGGPSAEVIRDLDRIHRLGEERAHWLALKALQLNAHFLKALLPSASIIELPEQGTLGVCILDAFAFMQRDDRLPHRWSVTSDSMAARAAIVLGADHLYLLKSVTIPDGMGWEEAGERGFVDEWFARTLRDAPPSLKVRAVNFRDWTP